MTNKTPHKVIEEGLAEYRELMKVHQSNMQVVELLDKPQVEIRIPFLEEWLRTYSQKLVEVTRGEERSRIASLCYQPPNNSEEMYHLIFNSPQNTPAENLPDDNK